MCVCVEREREKEGEKKTGGLTEEYSLYVSVQLSTSASAATKYVRGSAAAVAVVGEQPPKPKRDPRVSDLSPEEEERFVGVTPELIAFIDAELTVKGFREFNVDEVMPPMPEQIDEVEGMSCINTHTFILAETVCSHIYTRIEVHRCLTD